MGIAIAQVREDGQKILTWSCRDQKKV